MTTGVLYLALGVAMLLAVILPKVLSSSRLTSPMVLVGFGMLVGMLPAADPLRLDPLRADGVIQHVTEFTVLVALMGVGLALDRRLLVTSLSSWRRWSTTWRLLGIGMPLTIGGVAALAFGPLGVALPSAVLLGAVLAPTDPVLASDVQVEGPSQGDGGTEGMEIDENDEVRFALTSEAGLNDGLAFPFIYLGLFLAGGTAVSQWGWEWLAWDLLGRVVLGVLVGAGVGWALARIAFRSPSASLRLAQTGDPLLALAALLTAYGLSELIGGYGFLAVFACAMAIRSFERDHEYHRFMHQVIERLERLLTLVVLLVLGLALTDGLLANLDRRGVLVAGATVFLIRPLAGAVALRVRLPRRQRRIQLTWRQRVVVAFFGVRGVGSLFYLAFVSTHTDLPEERWLWSTVGFTVVLSVLVHGVLAGPAMTWQAAAPSPRSR